MVAFDIAMTVSRRKPDMAAWQTSTVCRAARRATIPREPWTSDVRSPKLFSATCLHGFVRHNTRPRALSKLSFRSVAMMQRQRPGMDRSTILRIGALVAPVAVYLGAYSVHHPDELLINPDSPSYLEFASMRTGGYPFFLAILKPFIRGPADYVGAQLVLYGLAVLAFGQQLFSTYRNPLLCFVSM